MREIGVAMSIELNTGAPREPAELTIDPSGTIELVLGTTNPPHSSGESDANLIPHHSWRIAVSAERERRLPRRSAVRRSREGPAMVARCVRPGTASVPPFSSAYASVGTGSRYAFPSDRTALRYNGVPSCHFRRPKRRAADA